MAEWQTRGNLLVAEDNLTNQTLIRALLKTEGYELSVVSNGVQAVAAVELRDYQLIFMDCHMPEMNGLEATRKIREREHRLNATRVPIVALTGNHSSDVRLACLRAGMDDFLSKPYDRRQLTQVLSHWLRA